MEQVLVVKLGALGDLLLADGALRDLRRHHPSDRITLLTRTPYVALMQRCPWVDAVIGDDKAPRWRLGRMAQLARRLRGHGFDVAYDLQTSRRSAFYRRWLLPAPAWSYDRPARRAERATRLPVLERHAAQLRRAGLDPVHVLDPHPLWIRQPLTPALERALAPPYVVLLPGSSARHQRKRWPGYRQLALELQRAGVSTVCVPGPDELDALRGFPGIVLLDEGRPLDLGKLASVLAGARFVVGNDSGPTHLAAHMGCRGLALFGAASPTPEQTGIVRPAFSAWQTPALNALPVEAVRAAVLASLAGRRAVLPPLMARAVGTEA